MLEQIISYVKNFISTYLAAPDFRATDLIEILIIAFLVYELMIWIRNTKAWMLFKGLAVVLIFFIVASIFDMTTILWIARQTLSVAVLACIIIFQPELRHALEQLGRRNFLSGLISIDSRKNGDERFSMKTIDELVEASFELAKTRTGALIVVEDKTVLTEYEQTGIPVDGIVTSQLLINIFEHNTPLHDGAVIVRGDRAVAATCYLPLSSNQEISKSLGTRHRAGLGMSEESDALIIIVSEETGMVSLAYESRLYHNVTGDKVRDMLKKLQVDGTELKKDKKSTISQKKGWKTKKQKGRGKDATKAD